MKLQATGWLVVVSLTLLRTASGQDFQNLDFESANLSPTSGQFGGPVPFSDAFPGWTGYIGATQVTQALQNNLTIGSPSIDILGPNWRLGFGLIEGQYTAVLQPADLGGGGSYSASISQSGLVPANARSLQFKAQTYSSFSVSLGGQDLSLVPLGTGANYTLYGADISPFAGQVETLTITALAAPSTADYFDSIVFSPSSVPEPSVFGLLALGGFFFGLRRSNCTIT
jgi:hypothetical protein